ncbi:procollagen galactosyltransferase [Aureococcus anophagefferens]|uniref:Procollagen galactosyltransferase n=1 Tax=Aureococcus anophagefferens TaxID=44056 RepID=A0ABR1FWI5_AURAN
MVGGVLRALFCFAVVVAAQRHRHVAHLARDFAFCVSEINVRDAFRTVKFAPEETAGEAAARVFAAAGADALDERIRPIAAFLEHRASLVLMERSEFRFALRSSPSRRARQRSSSRLSPDRDHGVDALDDGPAPRSVFDVELPAYAEEIRREAACAGGAPTVVAAEGFKARARGALARRAARPLPHLDAVLILNLARRPDRWRAMRDKLAAAGFGRRRVRRASTPSTARARRVGRGRRVDLQPDALALRRRREERAPGPRLPARVIGCAALSHLAAWKAVAAAADDHAMHLVLEDDAVFVDDFAAKWASLAPHLAADYPGISSISASSTTGTSTTTPLAEYGGVKRFSARQRSYGAGAFAYVLRPRTARWLLDAARRGIQQAVDWWIVEKFDELVAYKASPQLAASPAGDGRDSDNNEFYDQDRLLLDEGAGAADFDGRALRARPGDRVPAGAALEVAV